MASTTMATFSFISLSLFFFMLTTATDATNVSAVFAFGDSTVDPGNNNRLDTIFRSDHYPYGRDFPTHYPSGRFSDGKIATDFVTQGLGLKDLLPAYLDPRLTDQDLLTGVSFASGGTGLDPSTVKFAKVLDLPTQLRFFDQALQRIRNSVGAEKADEIVKNALFVVSIGTNDLLYNAYLMPLRIVPYGSVSGYQDFLLHTLQDFIQKLYGVGARKILVAGLPPMGCLPVQVTMSSIVPSPHWLQRVCNDQQNSDSQEYNTKLQSHLHLLNSTLNATKVAYFDIYSPILDMVQNPSKYGFEQTMKGCCGTGLLEMGPVCNILDFTCPDPSKFLFWDAVHLTERGNYYLAESGQKTVLPGLTN